MTDNERERLKRDLDALGLQYEAKFGDAPPARWGQDPLDIIPEIREALRTGKPIPEEPDPEPGVKL